MQLKVNHSLNSFMWGSFVESAGIDGSFVESTFVDFSGGFFPSDCRFFPAMRLETKGNDLARQKPRNQGEIFPRLIW